MTAPGRVLIDSHSFVIILFTFASIQVIMSDGAIKIGTCIGTNDKKSS